MAFVLRNSSRLARPVLRNQTLALARGDHGEWKVGAVRDKKNQQKKKKKKKKKRKEKKRKKTSVVDFCGRSCFCICVYNVFCLMHVEFFVFSQFQQKLFFFLLNKKKKKNLFLDASDSRFEQSKGQRSRVGSCWNHVVDLLCCH